MKRHEHKQRRADQTITDTSTIPGGPNNNTWSQSNNARDDDCDEEAENEQLEVGVNEDDNLQAASAVQEDYAES